MTLLTKRKDHRHAGILIRKRFHTRNIHTAFQQTVHAKFAEWIASNTRSKPHAAAQERNIVGKDCRRTAQGHRKIRGQMFSLGFKNGRKAVQNEIGIQFSENAYVKTLHSAVSFFLQQFCVNALLDARDISSQNAARECRQAIGSSASHCERKTLLKCKLLCGSVGQSCNSRVAAADSRFGVQRSSPSVNCRLL